MADSIVTVAKLGVIEGQTTSTGLYEASTRTSECEEAASAEVTSSVCGEAASAEVTSSVCGEAASAEVTSSECGEAASAEVTSSECGEAASAEVEGREAEVTIRPSEESVSESVTSQEGVALPEGSTEQLEIETLASEGVSANRGRDSGETTRPQGGRDSVDSERAVSVSHGDSPPGGSPAPQSVPPTSDPVPAPRGHPHALDSAPALQGVPPISDYPPALQGSLSTSGSIQALKDGKSTLGSENPRTYQSDNGANHVARRHSLLSQLSEFSSRQWGDIVDITGAESRGSNVLATTDTEYPPAPGRIQAPLPCPGRPSSPPASLQAARSPHERDLPCSAHTSASQSTWVSNNRQSDVKLPDINCSKYRIIGDPRLKRTDGQRDQRARTMEKAWKTPRLVSLGTLAGNKHNTIDEKTIYSEAGQRRWEASTDDRDILTPLEVSPRFKVYRPDGELLHERGIIMKDYFSTGRMRHFVRNKAIIPSVNRDYFSCPERKRSYVTDMYTETFRQPNDRGSVDCDRPKYGIPTLSCQYCDVIGNKYCSFCIECTNRHFYEWTADCIPPQKARSGGELNHSVISRISRSLDKMGAESSQTNKQVQRDLAALSLSPRKPVTRTLEKNGAYISQSNGKGKMAYRKAQIDSRTHPGVAGLNLSPRKPDSFFPPA